MPAARAIFSVFFLISLFNKILEYAKDEGYKENYSSILLFIGLISLNLLSYLPYPFGLISIFSILFFIPPFKALNFAKQNSDDFEVNKQDSFTFGQIAIIGFGIGFWGLVLIGLASRS